MTILEMDLAIPDRGNEPVLQHDYRQGPFLLMILERDLAPGVDADDEDPAVVATCMPMLMLSIIVNQSPCPA